MTDNLVKRLRDLAEEWCEMCDDIHEPLIEAASRIEDLEAQLKTVLDREAETHRRHDAKIEAQAEKTKRIGQNVLMWLGTYRDDLSQKAIANLQSIARAALGETK